MSFDEVVLVEPGEDGTSYTEEMFWDFVIVEGSKNNGKSWLPVTEGYDAGADELWNSSFTNTLKSAVSEAEADQDMFLQQTINLTETTEFEAGDTVGFRFRFHSGASASCLLLLADCCSRRPPRRRRAAFYSLRPSPSSSQERSRNQRRSGRKRTA